MSSTSNPYAPPKDGPFVAPPPAASEDGVITCTVLLTEATVAAGLLLTAKKIQWVAPIAIGVAAFIGTRFAGPQIQTLVTLGCATLGWFIAPKVLLINAGRALANKSEA